MDKDRERLGIDPRTALETMDFPESWGLKKRSGKVRDIFEVGDGRLVIVATDRLSAFDQQVGLIPNRGQVLTKLSQWWFEKTSDIVPNHLLAVPDPNAMLVRQFPTVDLEFVVRGFNTGSTNTSIWKRYQNGQREFGGVTLWGGMKKNERLPRPILDPSSRGIGGGHDQSLPREVFINSGVVTKEEYEQLETISLTLFDRGRTLAEEKGLILVDTKFEFGKDPETGRFALIDEIFTPDSSRLWDAKTYEERLKKGQEPDMYDKEFARLWFVAQGYPGEGAPPPLPQDVVMEIRARYIEVYERLTGNKFIVPQGDIHKRMITNVGYRLEKPF